jgi:integrase
MASLQARHTRRCATAKPWTPANQLDGCDCGPTFYVVVREGRRLVRERAGKNRKVAERALTKVQGQVDEGSFEPVKRTRFDVWADEWIAGLELDPSTVHSYRSTVAYAKRAFGHQVVRTIGTGDVKRMLELLRGEGLSDSTRAKHLRVLGACFESAIIAGHASRNPVRLIPKGERPRARRRESAYFTNDELPPLFGKLDESAYRLLMLAALKTGMRQGELVALTWGDVDLTDAVIRVRRSYTDGVLGTTKNHERRDVDVTADVVEMLGRWWGELGGPSDETLVFPGATKTGYVSSTMLRRELYAAMAAAGVPRVGPTGEERTFHSFRHTFAKRALENGRQITWLSRYLGHSSTNITTETYGHWERAERKREAELMEGVFGV